MKQEKRKKEKMAILVCVLVSMILSVYHSNCVKRVYAFVIMYAWIVICRLIADINFGFNYENKSLGIIYREKNVLFIQIILLILSCFIRVWYKNEKYLFYI